MVRKFDLFFDSIVSEKKQKRDRCLKKADQVYGKKTSAYKSGAVVRCRKGKIWKENELNSDLNIFEEAFQKLIESFEKEEKEGLHGWFSRNRGKGWIDCKTGKPCGRQEGEKRKSYPACRPTKAMCNSRKRLKKGSKRISWKKGDKT